jgi:hypothetical protein
MLSGKHLSHEARRAAKAKGLSAIGEYERLNNQQDEEILSEDDPGFEVVVIRAYSPGGKKSVDITAGDLYYYGTVLSNLPMAKV